MRKTTLIRPTYAESFRCIGPACEDSCCAGWGVSIDQATYEKYQTIPAGPLRTLIDQNIVRAAEGTDGAIPGAFAQIQMPRSLACPFHNAERLCQIQVEHGESYLSHTCTTFPRTTYVIDELEEKTLTVSCPEAARLVLLNPRLLAPNGKGAKHVLWDDAARSHPALRTYFWPIREFTVSLLRNRAYPLWQRMFLLGTFCRRLNAVVRGDLDRGFPALLGDFKAAVERGSLRASIETIPADLALQLEMVLKLVKLRVGGVFLSARLRECLNAFIRGVGSGEATTIESQSALYAAAYERYYAPFFLKHPYILENLLVNTIFRKLFPCGAKLFDLAAKPEPAKEYALLATEFALIKGLLIGVAGGHREAFSAEHVVQTVQTAFKHFEHNPDFLVKAQQLLAEKKLDDARGLTMLLRN